MLFNSFEFVWFFPLVVGLYFALPPRFRWILLLAASYYFYMSWRVAYIVLILSSTLVDYLAGRAMEGQKNRNRRRVLLTASLTANLGILFTFKYYDFALDSLQTAFAPWGMFAHLPELEVLLPVGISFYTFQSLSYTIEVYRGNRGAERHLGIFALYVAFFPQLVAGPIERPDRLLPQFRQVNAFEADRMLRGLKRMGWGFVQKMVIADRLAMWVDPVYASPQDYPGVTLAMATVFFSFQIYCDFAGYSDIAIGSAQIMGYELMENFRAPYFSRSPTEFWRRWHISLSSWFRDYLYIPLGGSRVSDRRRRLNIVAVFLLSGLWHGAAWTFVLWGGMHGLLMLADTETRRLREKAARFLGLDRRPTLLKAAGMLATFTLVTVLWVFFRAATIDDAFYIISHLATGWETLVHQGQRAELFYLGSHRIIPFWIAVGAIACLLGADALLEREPDHRDLFGTRALGFRRGFGYAVVLALVILGVYDRAEFIYFQF